MNYNELFLSAWESILKKYEHGKIKFLSESDFQSHLFSECLKWLSNAKTETPYKIHAERSIISPHKKTDIVLGGDEVAVEIKFEPDYPGMPASKKPVTFIRKSEGSGSIEHDVEKLSDYKRLGVKHAHFVMIDEDEFHKDRIIKYLRLKNWKTLKVNSRKSYSLLVTFD